MLACIQEVAVEELKHSIVVAGRWAMWESRSSDFQARSSARHFHGLRAFVGTQSGISKARSVVDCCRTERHLEDAVFVHLRKTAGSP